MFLRFDESKCPLCGTLGSKSEINNFSSCPKCGTKFNEFGLIHTPRKEIDLHWT